MKPDFHLMGTHFFAALLLSESGNLEALGLWLHFPASRDAGVARMVRATEISRVWAKKDLHYVSCRAQALFSSSSLQS